MHTYMHKSMRYCIYIMHMHIHAYKKLFPHSGWYIAFRPTASRSKIQLGFVSYTLCWTGSKLVNFWLCVTIARDERFYWDLKNFPFSLDNKDILLIIFTKECRLTIISKKEKILRIYAYNYLKHQIICSTYASVRGRSRCEKVASLFS